MSTDTSETKRCNWDGCPHGENCVHAAETVWVKTNSHRAVDKLRAVCTRAEVAQPVATRKAFAKGNYWQVPAHLVEELKPIAGLTVLSKAPVDRGAFYSGAIRSLRDPINGTPAQGSMRNLVDRNGKRIGGSYFTETRGEAGWVSWGIAGVQYDFATRKDAEAEQIAVWNAGPTTIHLVNNWLPKARRTLASAIERNTGSEADERLVAERREHLAKCEARREILMGSSFD